MSHNGYPQAALVRLRNLARLPTRRGEEKEGKRTGKQRGRPQTPDQGTGAKARRRGRRGGKSKKVLGWAKAHGRALDKVDRISPLLGHLAPTTRQRVESPLIHTKARPKFSKHILKRGERGARTERRAKWRDSDDGERSPSAEMAEHVPTPQAMKGETPIIQQNSHTVSRK